MAQRKKQAVSRRDVLKGVVAASAAVMLGSGTPITAAVRATKKKLNPIQRENAKSGARDWQLTNVRLDKKGERIHGLMGWEIHGDPPGLEIVAEGIVLAGGVTPKQYAATIYPGPKGNFVFNASTIFWAQGVSSPPGHQLPWTHWVRPHGQDERVVRITRNLINRAIK